MLKYTLTSLILFIFITGISAQTQEDFSRRRNEIALDVSPIFRMNQFNTMPLNLMYRHNFKPGSLRARISANIQNNSSESKNSNSNNSTESSGKFNSYDIEARLGWQMNKSLNVKNLHLYYGADLIYLIGGNKNSSTFKNYHTLGSSVNEQNSESSSYGSGIAPVLGLNLRLSKSFSIGIENSFDLIMSKTKGKNETVQKQLDVFDQVISESKFNGEQKMNNLTLNVNPIRQLAVYLSFHF